MKLVKINSEDIGLLVELPEGPHVVDLARSLGVIAAHDPVAGALINGTLKETSAWTALVNHWRYLRMPLTLLARTALTSPDDPRLVIQRFAHPRHGETSGIVALDITDAADLDVHDPTGRLAMARQFSEAAVAPVEQGALSTAENVQVVDFRRHNDPRPRRG
jgi:hypothetical protein